jgi:ParB family chromosome partitioning protein
MKAAKNALGRGLSSLVSTPLQLNRVLESSKAQTSTASEETKINTSEKSVAAASTSINKQADAALDSSGHENVSLIPVADIAAGSYQPRTYFTESEIRELADSVQIHGVIQPILVRKAAFGTYEIIAGERRWRAAKLAGLLEIPAIVRVIADQDCLEIAIIENIQRQDLNPIEEAMSYQRLAEEFALTQEQVAKKVGKDRATVANALRLLKLPDEIQQFVVEKKLSTGHAKCLLGIKEPSAQISLARKAVAENLSVRKLEEVVSRVVVLDTGTRKATEQIDNIVKENAASTPYPDIIERLRNRLGSKVAIKAKRDKSGFIEISYHNEAELDRLVGLIG